MSVTFTAAAQACIDEFRFNPQHDIDALRDGTMTRERLLAECLDGADEDRVRGWNDYVDAVCDAAGVAK